MIKISPLNKESEEESGSEEEVTREALEQIALQQYAKALELQRKGNVNEATKLLKDLLDTKLLYGVNKPAKGEKSTNPLLNMKYSSYKNLAWMLSTSGETDAAIEAYIKASELDETDLTLWYRLGQLYMRTKRYELALNAFQNGLQCNSRHWPCIDKIITLLLGLGFKEECIAAIHDALQLDPGYLRGIAYKKHIFNDYPHIKDFMVYLNPIYKWKENDNESFDEIKAQVLLKEAYDIHESFLVQQRTEEFKYVLPQLKLVRPISNLTWHSVGESLVQMHHYMTENYYSHACPIQFLFEKEKEEPVKTCGELQEIEPVENKIDEDNIDPERITYADNVSENENNDLSDKDEGGTDNEKVESDVEVTPMDSANGTQFEPKIPKKNPVRKRGSALSFLRQWEWCNKRRSGRKKPAKDDTIYETLRKMVPNYLNPEMIQERENQARDTSPDTANLNKLFDEEGDAEEQATRDYFGSEIEQNDVNNFIDKFTENKKDIIDILRNYLSILAAKWREKWPEGLANVFIEANKCYMNHFDVPACTSDNNEDLLHYTTVNILVEEFSINEKLISPLMNEADKQKHDLSVIETIGMILNMKPHIFVSTDCLELMLRHLWVKLHIHILNKRNDFALDCLYQLHSEFESMEEHHNTYSLNVVNFTFKPVINEDEIEANIKFLERNTRLSTIMDLYKNCNYEEVLSILMDSFEHCKTIARNEEEDMSLDFAIQLVMILDTYWALNKVDECFKWSLICLHETLKHYFRYTTGSQDYAKWSRTVVRILFCMEHILSTEGLACLDAISCKDLSQGIENIIRIIGHQVETNASEMPFGTVVPWIILHYILQREDDRGRNMDKVASDEVPIPLLLLFIAHEQLGNRGWCCNSEGKLLYFTLDVVVPRLRSPYLSKCIEQICMYMEQCVYCLYAHPTKKPKPKYLVDHGVTPYSLDWPHAQQLYEIFKPQELPALEGKVPGISPQTEQLFQRILSLLPQENDPSKYLPEIEKYIRGIHDKLPNIPPLIPFKMKDIYFLLGDYYFKKEEGKLDAKYNMLDVVINKDRLESWAQISLAKAVNLERILNSCRNLNNERDFLNPAKSVIRCFKRALELNPRHSNILIEYGLFVYTVHSFCSRLLKQASESLSMEDFQSLEKQKEDMLDMTQKCFITVFNEQIHCLDTEKANDEPWLHFYMLGKVAEKRNKPPSVYLDYYMKAVKSLQETEATYPLKINYSTPTHLCIEVLELHYRIHASILKYIEQHENKPIPASVGKVFFSCIEEWKNGPFNKKTKKDCNTETEVSLPEMKTPNTVHAANILKRSISDAGEDESPEAKRLKNESAAAKVRRSASYDTERLTTNKVPIGQNIESTENIHAATKEESNQDYINVNEKYKPNLAPPPVPVNSLTTELNKVLAMESEKGIEEKREESDIDKKEESSSSTSSSSSSSSSSSESSTDSSSDSDSESSSKSSNDDKPLTNDEIMKIVSSCLVALEDCTSRFPLHYKALYRLAHYHFYYKRGKDIERCRDLMLANFISRTGQKLGGLFSERKPSNFFNNIWKIPVAEVERAGGFAFHMNRSVLLTLEILKEIDDYKTLLEISLNLQKIPDADKKYLRDSDREELAQQAFLLCVQSLKGLLTKFSQQADVKSNNVERQALKSLMSDIYKAYQRVQKQPNAKQFINLLIESYKLVTTEPIPENANLTDISMRYCQRLKQEAVMASLDKTQNAQKKQAAAKAAVNIEATKVAASIVPVVNPSKPDQLTKAPTPQPTTSVSGSGIPKMSSHEIAAGFQNYLPILSDPVLSQQTAAALSLSYLSNISALASYSSLPTSLQSSIHSSLQNSFQAEFYRQFLGQGFSSLLPPVKKQKRGPKPGHVRSQHNPLKSSKSFSGKVPSSSKPQPTSTVSSLHKSNSTPLTPSMGTVLQNLPSSMTANLPGFGSHSISQTSHSTPAQAHMSTATTVNSVIHTKPPMPHQQSSPGKTLQEKLAERQKHLPVSKNQEINASIGKLPSSLTITKTSVPKQVIKKPELKKSLSFTAERPKPIPTDEVIVLDDD